MKYRNVITGTVINTPCKITGKNWEQVEEEVKLPPEGELPEGFFAEDPTEEEKNQEPEQEDPEQEDPEQEPAVPKPKTRRGKK